MEFWLVRSSMFKTMILFHKVNALRDKIGPTSQREFKKSIIKEGCGLILGSVYLRVKSE